MQMFSDPQRASLDKAITYISSEIPEEGINIIRRLIDENPAPKHLSDGRDICDCIFFIAYGPRDRKPFESPGDAFGHKGIREEKDRKIGELVDLLSDYSEI